MDSSNTLSAHPYWIDFSALYERSDAISQAYHSHNLVFFLGSGASKALTLPRKSGHANKRSSCILLSEGDR
jgi:hypothetical protein